MCSRVPYLFHLLLFCFVALVHGGQDQETISVNVNGLLPSETCSTRPASGKNSVEMSHPYGPCSPIGGKTVANPTLQDLIKWDRLRLPYIHHRFGSLRPTSTRLPAYYAVPYGYTGFVIKIGLGTPSVQQTVIVDTGSDLSWVHCKPCLSTCPTQQDTIFDPSKSSTYGKVSCAAGTSCDEIKKKTCSSKGECQYLYEYGVDASTYTFNRGYLSREKLSLTSTATFENFVFGCSNNDTVSSSGDKWAGLFGFGGGKLSVVKQTSATYGGIFSYCPPSSSSTTGSLTFGDPQLNTKVEYTPMLRSQRHPTFYFVDLLDISVGGQRLNIPSYVLKVTIMDSGTAITRLPRAAYSALNQAFRSAMTSYTLVEIHGLTCYDMTGLSSIAIPRVELYFRNVRLSLSATQTLIVGRADSNTVVACLAFLPSPVSNPLGIVGYIQQRGLEVIHDLTMGRVGFAAGTC